MKKTTMFAATIMFMAGFANVFAGEGYKCKASMEQCVNKMSSKFKTHGWIGIETEKTGKKMFSKITKVIEDSPAQRAGFQVGDVLVAINDISLTKENKAQIKTMKKGMAVGKVAAFTVKRGKHKKTLKATLAAPPSDILAQYVGHHVLASHKEEAKLATN